ncbi:uncharacterized protein [Palaemon carinicauda]|uniref:uncharacterized protein n=1 Tax=Palaemon carinicauda TaxID=392227 RepID=UPI0035B589A1
MVLRLKKKTPNRFCGISVRFRTARLLTEDGVRLRQSTEGLSCSDCDYGVDCPSWNLTESDCPFGVVKDICDCCDTCTEGPDEELWESIYSMRDWFPAVFGCKK